MFDYQLLILRGHSLVFQRWRPFPDPKSFVRGGPNLMGVFLFVFLVDKGIEDPNTAIKGASSAGQQNPIKWRFAGGPTMAQH